MQNLDIATKVTQLFYVGILNLGIKTILLEMTGKATINLAF
jgi:hypothetical protein